MLSAVVFVFWVALLVRRNVVKGRFWDEEAVWLRTNRSPSEHLHASCGHGDFLAFLGLRHSAPCPFSVLSHSHSFWWIEPTHKDTKNSKKSSLARSSAFAGDDSRGKVGREEVRLPEPRSFQ